jgi:ATP-dependent DNA helicase RecQ
MECVMKTVESILPATLSVTDAERRRLDSALISFFGYGAFRPGQAEAIACVLRGQSVMAVMPTGSGKSLCYQLAAMLLPATTLVISPLVALMKDQLDGLPATVAPRATALNYTLDGNVLEVRLRSASDGTYKLLYAAPERLRQLPFLHALRRAGVSLLVVDEAHCVSLWGHDFRPDYRFISRAWHELGRPPIMALTATATPRVQDDIQAVLGNMHVVCTGVERPNLRLEARRFSRAQHKEQALLGLCQEIEGSGIVYATSRKRCEKLAQLLRDAGISAIHYHAGIQDRAAAQERFMSGTARIVVATIAFGMGIDKADVRFVIHYDPPKTLESYFQEAGRAGRDGLPAHCILLHTPSDETRLARLARQDILGKEDLGAVHTAIQHRLGIHGMGPVTVADLERDLEMDETRLRVAIHFLEIAGLVVRGFDMPRTVTLSVVRAARNQDVPFVQFVEAAHLRPGQRIARETRELSRQACIPLDAIEAQLLAWRDAGWLEYRGTGRDMLLSLPEPPADSARRLHAILIDYEAGQLGRIRQVMSYAATRRCRHRFISAHFGAASVEPCDACDNCTEAEPAARQEPIQPSAPDRGTAHGDSAMVVLRGMATMPFPMSRTGLSRALKGLPTSPVQADRFPLFGALGSWTAKKIRSVIDLLVEDEMVARDPQRGSRLRGLTERGRLKLASAQTWEPAPQLQPGTMPAVSLPRAAQQRRQAFDAGLFDALRAWRLETAHRLSLAAFKVFHDSVLRSIASERPRSLTDLRRVPGVGPHKLEAYGQEILDIVAAQPRTPDSGSE